tara:strand:- start:3665 stop:5188 length:1524 start_codon:yes stop_codon:yes gene_type:complete
MNKNKHLKFSKYLFSSLFFVGFLLVSSCVKDKEKPKALPNIILILADDLGYGDLGSYNVKSLIPTPNLDKLASEGISFTNAYCPVSVCSPSRYALMTGTYPFRSWKKSGVLSNYEPSMIDDGQLTLPKMLQQAGYATAGFGKWHLGATFPTLDGLKPTGYGEFKTDNNGKNIDLGKPISNGPVDMGFENWFGFSCASECWVMDGNTIVAALQHDFYNIDSAVGKEHIEIIPSNEYLKLLTKKSIGFLSQRFRSVDENPFFLYFAPYVPHIPLSVSDEFIGTTEAGAYGDYVSELDSYIGEILDTLERSEQADNTIIIFASDNGSQFERTGVNIDNTNPNNNLGDVKIKTQNSNEHHPNGNLKGSKWTIWEGGVRMPFIVKWSSKIPSGIKSNKIFALNDVMATLSSIIEYDLPNNAAVDSFDQTLNFMGKDRNIRKSVVVQSSKNQMGLRKGDWKFIAPDNGELQGQLYNLLEDASESNNLINSNTDLANEMQNELLGIIAGKVSED